MATSNAAERPATLAYRAVLVALFLLGIGLPLLDWRFDLDHAPDLTENRSSAAAPAWPMDRAGWLALPSAVQAYWNDAFGYRRRLIRWNAILNYKLGLSPSPSVVIGAHSLLYYTGEDSFPRHRGQHPLTDAELDNWAQRLEERRQWLASRNAHFLFVIAPDKQSVYPDEVPARYGPFGRTPLDQLIDYLHAHSQVDVLDLRDALRRGRSDGPVFSATDTHWNDAGAFLGYSALVQRLRVWFPAMAPRLRASFVRHPMPLWAGDLGRMLPGLKHVVAERGEQWQATPPTTCEEAPLDAYRPPDGLLFSVFVCPGHPELPRAVMFHDSFFLASDERGFPGQAPLNDALTPPPAKFRPRPLLAEQFSRSAFSWQHQFDRELIEREHADVVIEEIVERMLPYGPQ